MDDAERKALFRELFEANFGLLMATLRAMREKGASIARDTTVKWRKADPEFKVWYDDAVNYWKEHVVHELYKVGFEGIGKQKVAALAQLSRVRVSRERLQRPTFTFELVRSSGPVEQGQALLTEPAVDGELVGVDGEEAISATDTD